MLLLRTIYLILLLAILLPFGSVEAIPLHLSSLAFLALACVALVLGPRRIPSGPLVGLALAISFLLAGWIAVRAWAFEGNSFANGIWQRASAVLGEPLSGAISIQPADTLAAAVPCLLPFAVFISGLLLFPSDRSAVFLLRFIAVSGIVFAAFALVQFTFFPSVLLFIEKRNYVGSLTAMFVNRNTAATYLGAILVVTSALAFNPVRAILGHAVKALLGQVGAPLRSRRTTIRG